MGDNTTPSLRAGHRRALGLDTHAASAPEPKTYKSVERLFEGDQQEALKTIPPWIVKKAWFALAHLLLEPGSTVIDIGSRDGAMAYTMAVLAPNMQFIGIDKNAETVERAAELYKQPNLEFRIGDALDNAAPENSADAVICNFVLHEIFSNSDFNQRQVRQTLRQCHRYLKPGGHLFIRDYAEPASGENLVLMEMPDSVSRSTKLEELSEPDLLVWYSEYATLKDEPGTSGFYLEELPARFPRTRLFRLPHKWAYEFIMRKDARARWQDEVPKEYTFFNEREYQKTLNALGLRVLYSAPHWDDVYIKKHFEGHFRLLDESGTALGHPATSFAVLAQKVDPRDALILTERRKAKVGASQFHITTYRNDIDGRLIDVVSRNMNTTEIIPFSVMNGNRLVIYLHEGVPRGLVNAVPRGGRNLDGKFWSGHLTEAIAVDTEIIRNIEEQGTESAIQFVKNALGLRVSVGQSFVEGPGYFPNPRFIAERVETRFVSVEPKVGRYVPDFVREDIRGFASTGAIKAFDAQSVLNAISVGALPAGNLEMQLLMLFSMLEIKATDWAETPLVLKEEEPIKNVVKVSDILKKTEGKDNRYKEMRGNQGKIKIEKSVFVDEGMDDEGTNRGLAARDVDFVINEETGLNVAVILPLSKQHSGEVMAGVIIDFLPIPQRFNGDGKMISLPMINLPHDIQSMDMARKYIAEKFEIKPDQVAKMGEPYFSYVGVTPQRIFPFAINCPATKMAQPRHGLTAYTPMANIGRLHWKDLFERYDIDMLKVCGRANKRFFSQNEMGMNWGFEMPLVPKYSQAPFTTGTVVDVRMPITGGQPVSAAPPPAPSASAPSAPKPRDRAAPERTTSAANSSTALPAKPDKIPASEMAGIYAGGFSRASKATDRGDARGGKGGGKGGSSGAAGKRAQKPAPDKKKKNDGMFTKPEPGQS